MDASGSALNGPTPAKRRRVQRSPSPPQYSLDDNDDYEPYVPVAQRRQARLAKLTSWGANGEKSDAQKKQEAEEREDDTVRLKTLVVDKRSEESELRRDVERLRLEAEGAT